MTRRAVPGAIGRLRLASHYRAGDPTSALGGDWLDAVETASHAVLIVGDVQGHDHDAASLMCELRASAHAAASDGEAPEAILHEVNRALGQLSSERIVTALAVGVELSSRTIVAASAGHLPPFVVRPGWFARELAIEPGPPLGIGTSWPEITDRLDTGSGLFMYTDGLVEARGWPIDHGIELLRAALSNLPPTTGLNAMLDAALDIIPSGSRDDDVAVLAAAIADPG